MQTQVYWSSKVDMHIVMMIIKISILALNWSFVWIDFPLMKLLLLVVFVVIVVHECNKITWMDFTCEYSVSDKQAYNWIYNILYYCIPLTSKTTVNSQMHSKLK